MDFKHEWRKYEMEDQMRSETDWDDYESESYGWEKSSIRSLKQHFYLELSNEFGITSIQHRTRHFRKG
ncbi:MAG: hypothetical protein GX994_03915 [Firmicutes bacterium]|nr:hypothetical protein [Bacillota bacterium]